MPETILSEEDEYSYSLLKLWIRLYVYVCAYKITMS